VCASTALTIIISRLATIPILAWGSEDMKRQYVTRIARGESQGSYCLSEPDAGSDVASLSTRAERDGDHYVLTGTKYWITNAGITQGAIDAAAAYMKERRQFGHPIADFQGLQFVLADMAMKTEAARGLVHRACALIDEGDPRGELTVAGAMAKCFASDVAMEV